MADGTRNRNSGRIAELFDCLWKEGNEAELGRFIKDPDGYLDVDHPTSCAWEGPAGERVKILTSDERDLVLSQDDERTRSRIAEETGRTRGEIEIRTFMKAN